MFYFFIVSFKTHLNLDVNSFASTSKSKINMCCVETFAAKYFRTDSSAYVFIFYVFSSPGIIFSLSVRPVRIAETFHVKCKIMTFYVHFYVHFLVFKICKNKCKYMAYKYLIIHFSFCNRVDTCCKIRLTR